MENNEKRPLKEDWRLIKRAISIWNEIAPHYWFWRNRQTMPRLDAGPQPQYNEL